MSIFYLVWSYLKAKLVHTVLNIFLLSLGVAVITLIILTSHQLQERIENNAKGIDLVVGAKGSPLQLILCSIFHIDFPTGNINLVEAEKLAGHRLIKSAIPLALGDSYSNFRIVGTTLLYPQLYKAELLSGEWWNADLEVVIGSTVATTTQLKVGDTFESAHGLTKDGHAHDESHYTVRGILKNSGTVIDNLILTNIQSVWIVHNSEEKKINLSLSLESKLIKGFTITDSTQEITSLLVKYKNPIAAIQLPRMINTQTKFQAASPAFETTRLFSLVGSGVDALMGLAYLLIFISVVSIFIALYNSLKERKYDLAIMRSMGASRFRLVQTIMLEGVSLTAVGTSLGLLIGHLLLYLFIQSMGQEVGLTANAFYLEEVYVLVGGIAVGLLCSALPAAQAYKTDIHRVLAGN